MRGAACVALVSGVVWRRSNCRGSGVSGSGKKERRESKEYSGLYILNIICKAYGFSVRAYLFYSALMNM